jgi:hypothetical protein
MVYPDLLVMAAFVLYLGDLLLKSILFGYTRWQQTLQEPLVH